MKFTKLTSITVVTIVSFLGIAACSNINSDLALNDTQITRSVSKNNNQVKVYSENGIAIKGADPVGYFKQGKVVRGSDRFSYQWNDATWHFASAENRDLFASNPEKYAPQYGGYCAWAVSQGYTAPIDPDAWKIVDGKLYLNYNKRIQRTWERDIPGNIAKADRNWPGVLNK